ncbi:MAG: tungstate ABC transporter substrate-binding protein WtpA [Marinilabiliales bacterium]
MKKIKLIILSIAIIFSSCSIKNDKNNVSNNEKKSDVKGKLIIFHAGSLSVPVKQIIETFNEDYPDVKILTEVAGSRMCARKITELHKQCDIMISADYKVIDNLLIPNYADWNIKFASNEMVIAFTDKSKCSDSITEGNWYKILLKDDVIVGRSDPDLDPCGYRTVLTFKLAEKYYNQSRLATKLIEKNSNYIRPKETDLLSLLESNIIDYLFIYRSVAEQHKLKYIVLPDSINLKNPLLQDYYAGVSLKISGKTPGDSIVKYGEPMIYGITIIKNSTNKDLAIKFVDYFLNEQKGMKVLESNGQPSLIPSHSNTYNNVPDELKKYVKP